MTYIINYNVNTGLSIDAARKSDSRPGDIGDLALALQNGAPNTFCELEGAKYALEDGAYWSGLGVSQETLEEIHALVCQGEAVVAENNAAMRAALENLDDIKAI